MSKTPLPTQDTQTEEELQPTAGDPVLPDPVQDANLEAQIANNSHQAGDANLADLPPPANIASLPHPHAVLTGNANLADPAPVPNDIIFPSLPGVNTEQINNVPTDCKVVHVPVISSIANIKLEPPLVADEVIINLPVGMSTSINGIIANNVGVTLKNNLGVSIFSVIPNLNGAQIISHEDHFTVVMGGVSIDYYPSDYYPSE